MQTSDHSYTSRRVGGTSLPREASAVAEASGASRVAGGLGGLGGFGASAAFATARRSRVLALLRREGSVVGFILLLLVAIGGAVNLSADRSLHDRRFTVDDLEAGFAGANYDLSAVRRGDLVPRLFMANLPQDLASLSEVSQRKQLFLKTMLPLILRQNEKILDDRERLTEIMENRLAAKVQDFFGQNDDALWIAELARKYGLQVGEGEDAVRDEQFLQQLLKRVDLVPPAMALAQGAIESAWGTSRFARQGNALFGQWTYKKGTGLVPLGRAKDAAHEIRIFDTVEGSVASYMRNLNTHRAYKHFRNLRAEQRFAGDLPGSGKLVDAMVNYSELGEAYVTILRTVIRVNRLHELDNVQLKAPKRAKNPYKNPFPFT